MLQQTTREVHVSERFGSWTIMNPQIVYSQELGDRGGKPVEINLLSHDLYTIDAYHERTDISLTGSIVAFSLSILPMHVCIMRDYLYMRGEKGDMDIKNKAMVLHPSFSKTFYCIIYKSMR